MKSNGREEMAKKRKSGGRSKGSKGKGGMVQCSACGRLVPVDKVKKETKYVTLVDPTLARELRREGTFIPRQRTTKNYCVSCAVHRGSVKIRSKADRKTR
ncbi:MAG: 30S ribosomal protein S26e [Candidatus Heimdallarchaeota archaeon]